MIKTMACSGLLFFFSVFLMHFLPTFSQLAYVFHYCNYAANYSSNSAFQINLNASFSSLYDKAHSNGFYSTSAGESPDNVYSLFLCRGDVSAGICQNCIMAAIEEITKNCPNQKEAFIKFEQCVLRYSNRYSIREISRYHFL